MEHRGLLGGQDFQTWIYLLPLLEILQLCTNCKALRGEANCILLYCTNSNSQIRCFPIKSGGREVGFVNIYFDNELTISEDGVTYFVEVLESVGNALEKMNARFKDIAALLDLQTQKYHQGFLSNNLYLSVNKQVVLEMKSQDVLPPFWVPE